MPFSLVSPPPPPPPIISPTISSFASNRPLIQKRCSRTIAKASEDDDGKPAFNPFGFVTDKPSSRSAIQIPESPVEDGNVGQMLYRIEDNGKEHGSYIKSGGFQWFVRETGSPERRRGTIVFLHGAPTQSYSYRVIMSQAFLLSYMAEAGFRCFAPDWIVFGFSDKPQTGYGFDYTAKVFHTWHNPEHPIDHLIPTSWTISTTQNAVMAERFIEARSACISVPYLSSSGPGFALLEAAKRATFKDINSQISAGFASGSWNGPILVAWGISDKYLPQSVTEESRCNKA